MVKNFEPYAYALMRIVTGLLFMLHGFPKLVGLVGGRTEPLSQMALAGVIEVFGGLLVMIGLFTAPVAFICSGEMAVAYFQAHFPRSFLPAQSGGELAALFCFVFLYLFSRGNGRWSVGR